MSQDGVLRRSRGRSRPLRRSEQCRRSAQGDGVGGVGTVRRGDPESSMTLAVTSDPVTCPPEAAGRRRVSRSHRDRAPSRDSAAFPRSTLWSYGAGSPSCPASLVKPLATTGRFVVAGKGELHFALAQGARCVDVEPVRNEPQNFTITGGTGTYQGASGSGMVERAVSAGTGSETWTGTIVVSGLEFDVTSPTLSGARAKTVRAPRGAKRVRVTYKVTASDNADSQVPVTCEPRSGSRFPIGRSTVRCSATDSSANTGKASFRITVRATK